MHEAKQSETPDLMRDYVANGDEAAFRQLVERYLPLVFGAALRRCHGRRVLAEEVTQDVFTKFAQRMPQLKADERIGAWLHRAATFRAGDLMRAEQRRRQREHLAAAMIELDNLPEVDAWNLLAPHIDAAMARLRSGDREILVSHYLEGMSLTRLAESLNVSDAAVRKRVQRALGRLRGKLNAQQLAITAATLATLFRTQIASANILAAKGLANAVASEALASASAGPFLGLSFLGNVGLGVIAALVVGAIPIILHGTTALDEAPPSPAASLIPAKRLREAAAVPQLSLKPKKNAPETLEEIVVALGELLSRPSSTLDIARREILSQQILSEQAGDALKLMDRLWSEEMFYRLEHRDFTGGRRSAPKREDLFQQWAKREPKEALDWTLQQHRSGVYDRLSDSFAWEHSIEAAIKQWGQEDLSTVLSWIESAIDSKAFAVRRDIRFARKIADAICPLVYKHFGARRSVVLMVKLEETKVARGIDIYIFNNAVAFKTSQDFREAMEVIDTEVDSHIRRSTYRKIMLRYWKDVDWQGGLDWVKGQGHLGYQAELGWELGFPQEVPAGFDTAAHARWLQSLDSLPGEETSRSAILAIMARWFPNDPYEATEWILTHDILTKDSVDDLLSTLPRSDELREASRALLHKVIERFPDQVDKHALKESSSHLPNPLFKEILLP